MTAISLVDVLDHLLAPFMLEVDIDIGRLLALLGDEAVEQQRVFGGVDAGDSEAVADRRIGGATAPLAQDRRILRAGEIDDLLDGEEIAREAQLGDQREFALERVHDGAGRAGGIAILCAPPCLALQEFLWRHAVGIYFLGIFVG